MERRVAYFYLAFSAVYLSLYLFHQQYWFQEVLSSYWLIFLIGSVAAIFFYLKRTRRGPGRVRAGLLLALLCWALFHQVGKAFCFFKEISPSVDHSLAVQVSLRFDAEHALPDEHGPDIFISGRCPAGAQPVPATGYPYSATDSKACLTVYSRYPLRNTKVEAYGQDLEPVLSTEVEAAPQERFTMIAVNLPRAFSQSQWNSNRLTLRRISTDLRHSEKPAIILGEFSSTTFGRVFDSFIDAARMKDAYWGRGTLPFSVIPLPMGFPTIHALYSGPIVSRDISPSRGGFFFSFYLFPDLV